VEICAADAIRESGEEAFLAPTHKFAGDAGQTAFEIMLPAHTGFPWLKLSGSNCWFSICGCSSLSFSLVAIQIARNVAMAVLYKSLSDKMHSGIRRRK
jgi:hypothetical protein